MNYQRRASAKTMLLAGLSVFFVLLSLSAKAQDTLKFSVLTYNVENLFDTRHDSLKNDRDFLPEGSRRWNQRKYRNKINHIAKAIIASGGWNPPALIGLCEVENDYTLTSLTRYSPLRELDYRFICTESDDPRGIDVALLYSREYFKPISQQSISIKEFKTRDILHVAGILLNLDTLDVFVAHLPSRRNGAKASEHRRIKAAQYIRNAADSILSIRENPQIIIMGDFNDTPQDKSVRDVLKARTATEGQVRERDLYHLLAHKCSRKSGSYKYRGRWQLIDHIIVSGNLLNPSGTFFTDLQSAAVVTAPFLLTEDKKYGGKKPFATFYGWKYLNGYSDHLPVIANFLLIY